MKKKIAHFGAYDHDSYGDLLFPHIVEHFLPDFDITHIAPTNLQTVWPDGKPIISIQDALQRTDWNGILIGGGDIIQSGGWYTSKWEKNCAMPFTALPSLWVGASFLAAKLNIPLAWNTPGVPFQFSDTFASTVELVLQAADYISVRDKKSHDNLSNYSHQTIEIIPDSALLINQLWPPSRKESHLTICLSFNDIATRPDDIRSAIKQARILWGEDLKVIILPLMAWQYEQRTFENNVKALDIKAKILPRSTTFPEIASLISSSCGYIGNSLHGFISAVSYGVPAILVVPDTSQTPHKYEGFLKTLGLEVSNYLTTNWSEAPTQLKSCGSIKISKIERQLYGHWEKIRNVFSGQVEGKEAVWDKIAHISHAEAELLSLHGIFPLAFQQKTTAMISSLNDKANRLSEQIQVEQAKSNDLTLLLANEQAKSNDLAHQLSNEKVENESLVKHLQVEQTKVANISMQFTELNQKTIAMDSELSHLRHQYHLANMHIQNVHSSHSWQLTKPLRLVSRITKEVIRKCNSSYLTYKLKLKHLNAKGIYVRTSHLLYVIFNRCLYKLRKKNQGVSIKCLSDKLNIQQMNTESTTEHSVSIVIPTYNAGSDIAYLLSSLKKQKKCNVQIVIVDSESSDMTWDIAKSYGTDCIQIRKMQFSHSSARNLGTSMVKNDKALFMVQDALPTDDWWLWRFCHIFETSEASALSCVQMPRSDADLMAVWNILNFNKFLGLNESGTVIESDFKYFDEWDARRKCQLDNVACMYKTGELMKYKFRGKYGEDIQMGRTLLEAGKKVAKTSEVKVIHSHNRDAFYYLCRTVVDSGTLLNLNLMPLPSAILSWNNITTDSRDAIVYCVSLLKLFDKMRLPSSFKDIELSIISLDKNPEFSFSAAADKLKFYDVKLAASLSDMFNDNSTSNANFRNRTVCNIEYLVIEGIKYFSNIYSLATPEFIELLKKFVLQSAAITIGTHIANIFVTDKIPKEKKELVINLTNNV